MNTETTLIIYLTMMIAIAGMLFYGFYKVIELIGNILGGWRK